jgi:hypothetical protein
MRKYCPMCNDVMRRTTGGTEYCYSCWNKSEKRRMKRPKTRSLIHLMKLGIDNVKKETFVLNPKRFGKRTSPKVTRISEPILELKPRRMLRPV